MIGNVVLGLTANEMVTLVIGLLALAAILLTVLFIFTKRKWAPPLGFGAVLLSTVTVLLYTNIGVTPFNNEQAEQSEPSDNESSNDPEAYDETAEEEAETDGDATDSDTAADTDEREEPAEEENEQEEEQPQDEAQQSVKEDGADQYNTGTDDPYTAIQNWDAEQYQRNYLLTVAETSMSVENQLNYLAEMPNSSEATEVWAELDNLELIAYSAHADFTLPAEVDGGGAEFHEAYLEAMRNLEAYSADLKAMVDTYISTGMEPSETDVQELQALSADTEAALQNMQSIGQDAFGDVFNAVPASRLDEAFVGSDNGNPAREM